MTDAEFIAYRDAFIDGNHLVHVSRIRFRMSPVSRSLAKRLFQNKQKQVLFDDPRERLEIWPLDEQFAIMEMRHRVPRSEGPDLPMVHRLHAEAQGHVLELVDGFSELVYVRNFRDTDPRND